MESGSGGRIKIDKLMVSNFQSWRRKVELVLAFRDVEDAISDAVDPHTLEGAERKAWLRKDKIDRAMIELSLSDDMLENVRECDTARALWETILNIFERHTLVNKLRARREFYTVTMKPGEKVLPYMNRVRQRGATLKSMGVDVDDKEIAMAALNGLPARYEYIITALDAVSDRESRFTYDLVKSRLLQEEQRAHMRTEADHVDRSALFNRIADVAR